MTRRRIQPQRHAEGGHTGQGLRGRERRRSVQLDKGVKNDDKAESPTNFMLKSSGCGVDCGDTLRKGLNVGYQDLHCRDWIRMDSKVKIYIAEMYWMTRQSPVEKDDL